jgi:hypothetical protein
MAPMSRRSADEPMNQATLTRFSPMTPASLHEENARFK